MTVKLNSLDNNQVDFSSLLKRSKPNLVLFYNTLCLGCTGRALPFAYKLSKEFSNMNLMVIHTNFGNTSFTTSEILEVFTAKTSPFEIYIDPKAELYNDFNCEGTPHWILLDANLKVFRSIFGSQVQAQQRLWYALEALES